MTRETIDANLAKLHLPNVLAAADRSLTFTQAAFSLSSRALTLTRLRFTQWRPSRQRSLLFFVDYARHVRPHPE